MLINTDKFHELKIIVNMQAEDDGLWFIAETASEAYLQQSLRYLHDFIEKVLPLYEEDDNE